LYAGVRFSPCIVFEETKEELFRTDTDFGDCNDALNLEEDIVDEFLVAFKTLDPTIVPCSLPRALEIAASLSFFFM
jgi:hypothetical protein